MGEGSGREGGPFFDQDSELAERARNGDKQAFEELVRKHQAAIYSFALHFFRSPDGAEDSAQETFLRAYRFLHTYDPSRKFITWLYSIARNICIDRHRERTRHEQVSIDDVAPALLAEDDAKAADPMRRMEEHEERRSLVEAIDALPEKYRTPILLCYMQGLPYQDASDILGISLNNLKIRIFRAKKLLIEKLGASEES